MKLFSINFRRGLIFGAVFVVVPLVAWFGYNKWDISLLRGAQSHLAVGVFKEASNQQIIILGNHVNDDSPNVIYYANRQDFTVIIKPDTKFVKLAWYFPESLEELTKKRISLKSSDIKKDKLAGSLEELKNMRGTSVKIKTEKNTFRKTIFEALEVEYVVPVYPK